MCCKCEDGPKLYENQPSCVMCHHRICDECTLEQIDPKKGEISQNITHLDLGHG
jgi:hypothetical protein